MKTTRLTLDVDVANAVIAKDKSGSCRKIEIVVKKNGDPIIDVKATGTFNALKGTFELVPDLAVRLANALQRKVGLASDVCLQQVEVIERNVARALTKKIGG